MNSPEIAKIKQSRKRLLEYLNILYGTPLVLNTLFEAMIGIDYSYDLPIFVKDIKYLKDKGYIEFIDEKIGGGTVYLRKVISLTPKGKEIAEGTQTDPALEL